jgi:predicted RNA binding protein YcfA (HicA-like mRNA interferase family)
MFVALPLLSGRKVIRALAKAGFTVEGRRGSHVKLKKRVDKRVIVVVVPDHSELAKGILRSILRQANLTREEFLKML